MKELIEFIYQVPDYEHRGDLELSIVEIKEICPNAEIIKSWEERDSEAEWDESDEYGELDEPIYIGFVRFKAPKEYKQALESYGCQAY